MSIAPPGWVAPLPLCAALADFHGGVNVTRCIRGRRCRLLLLRFIRTLRYNPDNFGFAAVDFVPAASVQSFGILILGLVEASRAFIRSEGSAGAARAARKHVVSNCTCGALDEKTAHKSARNSQSLFSAVAVNGCHVGMPAFRYFATLNSTLKF